MGEKQIGRELKVHNEAVERQRKYKVAEFCEEHGDTIMSSMRKGYPAYLKNLKELLRKAVRENIDVPSFADRVAVQALADFIRRTKVKDPEELLHKCEVPEELFVPVLVAARGLCIKPVE